MILNKKEIGMENFFSSLEKSIETQNWYSALALALTMPDICGGIMQPTVKGRQKYIKWYDLFLLDKYTSYIGADHVKHIFLSGRDCYALRCALLHEGSDDISSHDVREALSKFSFRSPRPGQYIHCNQFDSMLQLQIDIFCSDVLQAARKWWVPLSDGEKEDANQQLLSIH